MQIKRIELERLINHPDNSNVMSEALLAKLVGHIKRTGRYEPLVVRPHPQREGDYELLNGHHRREALGRLGHSHADCVVWAVDDSEALMLLATLNRLSGRDDAVRRAELLDKLSRRYSGEQLAGRLPETKEQLVKRLALRQKPEVVEPVQVGAGLEALTFFVSAAQKALINRALRYTREEIGGDDAEGRLSRGGVLAVMAHRVIKEKQPPIDRREATRSPIDRRNPHSEYPRPLDAAWRVDEGKD